jgi:hypothetical protein
MRMVTDALAVIMILNVMMACIATEMSGVMKHGAHRVNPSNAKAGIAMRAKTTVWNVWWTGTAMTKSFAPDKRPATKQAVIVKMVNILAKSHWSAMKQEINAWNAPMIKTVERAIHLTVIMKP